MIFRIISLALLTLTMIGCANTQAKHSDKQLDRTSFFIRFNESSIIGGASTYASLEELWREKAKELCSSDDFYSELNRKRLNKYSQESAYGSLVVYGVAYCNNKIIDTRKQDYDENFIQYTQIPVVELAFTDVTPLWNYLVSSDYELLNKEILSAYEGYKSGAISDEEIASYLETFSRINPVAEDYLGQWIEKYPDSSIALYSRSVFYHNFSWFKRGSRLWKDVTEEQRAGLKKYRELALMDIKKSIEIDPGFCPAHAKRLQILKSIKIGVDYEKEYLLAKSSCPNSMSVRSAYLGYLLPRWSGSKEKMRSFIDQSIAENKVFEALNAHYLAEEGDQLLFAEKYEGAYKLYEEAIGVYPSSFNYHQRGLALENLGRYIEAIESYDMAVNISPYYNSAYEGLTRTLIKQNNLVGALKASSYLVEVNNQNPQYFNIQGNMFYQMRRYEDALLSYKRAEILSKEKALYKHKIRKAEYQIEVRTNTPHSNDSLKPIKA